MSVFVLRSLTFDLLIYFCIFFILLSFLNSRSNWDHCLSKNIQCCLCQFAETWASQVGSIPGQEDPLKEGMATHPTVLAWRIPWTEEPVSLWSIGLQRVRHAKSQTRLSDLAHSTWIFSVVQWCPWIIWQQNFKIFWSSEEVKVLVVVLVFFLCNPNLKIELKDCSSILWKENRIDRKKVKGKSPHFGNREQGQGLISASSASWTMREEAGIGGFILSRSFANMLTRLPLLYLTEWVLNQKSKKPVFIIFLSLFHDLNISFLLFEYLIFKKEAMGWGV